MEKVALILLSTLILSGCSSYGMQGNPAAVQAGAAIGGVLGAIVGDRAGGYNASQFGALAGTVAGAAVGNAVTTPRQDDGAEEEYDNYAPAYSGLHVTNLRFIDENRNHTIDAEEDSKLVFDVVNDGDTPAYNVTPIIEEVTGMKHILISPAQQIAGGKYDSLYGNYSRWQKAEDRRGCVQSLYHGEQWCDEPDT